MTALSDLGPASLDPGMEDEHDGEKKGKSTGNTLSTEKGKPGPRHRALRRWLQFLTKWPSGPRQAKGAFDNSRRGGSKMTGRGEDGKSEITDLANCTRDGWRRRSGDRLAAFTYPSREGKVKGGHHPKAYWKKIWGRSIKNFC